MTQENKGENRIAALEAELARVQAERALMDARIRSTQVDLPAQGSRRADVLAWSAFFVAAALVTSLLVTIASQAPVVREHTRVVETVVVPEAAPPMPAAQPEAHAAVEPPSRPGDGRVRPARPATPMMTELLDDDRCGSDPTCGI